MGIPQFLLQLISLTVKILVGVLSGFVFVKIMKKRMVGHLWGAIIVGVVGSILGSFMDPVIVKLGFLITNDLHVNFVAAFIGAFLLIWIFAKLGHE